MEMENQCFVIGKIIHDDLFMFLFIVVWYFIFDQIGKKSEEALLYLNGWWPKPTWFSTTSWKLSGFLLDLDCRRPFREACDNTMFVSSRIIGSTSKWPCCNTLKCEEQYIGNLNHFKMFFEVVLWISISTTPIQKLEVVLPSKAGLPHIAQKTKTPWKAVLKISFWSRPIASRCFWPLIQIRSNMFGWSPKKFDELEVVQSKE